MNTSQKIALAKYAYRVVKAIRLAVGKSTNLQVTRGGLRWQLCLDEGIDFSIYALGGFELATLRLYRHLIRPGDVVLDIGANVGSHTLPLAARVGPSGRVVAFEPTAFAVAKLRANMALNPDLARRITVVQAMLVATKGQEPAPTIFSSWPLEDAPDLHEQHKGRLMATSGAVAMPLDVWAERERPARLDFVKIDVDGHEPAVLEGARQTLARFQPTILLEMAPYLFADRPTEFEGMLCMLRDGGYQMTDVGSGRFLPLAAMALSETIPAGGSRNVLLRPTAT